MDSAGHSLGISPEKLLSDRSRKDNSLTLLQDDCIVELKRLFERSSSSKYGDSMLGSGPEKELLERSKAAVLYGKLGGNGPLNRFDFKKILLSLPNSRNSGNLPLI